MDIKELIIKSSIREDSGSTASSRLNYQKDWSICHLLEQHPSSKDYVYIFDFQDDLLILDSEEKPTLIRVFQIKTKESGEWTIKSLIASRKNRKTQEQLLSIIGKLYSSKIKYKDQLESLSFVTNTSYDIQLKDGSNSRKTLIINGNNLTEEDTKSINDAIIAEYKLTENPACENILCLIMTDLSLKDHRGHTMGKLADFMEATNPGNYRIPLLYRTLFDFVTKRTDYSGKLVKSYDDLLKNKSITRKDFEAILAKFIATKDENYEKGWKSIETALSLNHFTVQEMQEYKTNYRLYTIEKFKNNSLLNSLYAKIKQSYDKLIAGGKLNVDLKTSLDLVLEEYKKDMIDQDLYNDNYLKTIVLVLIYNE